MPRHVLGPVSVVGPVLAALAVTLACGGGGGASSSGGGGAAQLDATGSIPLQATQFTSVVQATSCSASGVPVGVAFAAIGASDQAGMCSYLQQGKAKQGAKTIAVLPVRLDPLGAASIVPDTYPVVAQPTATQERYALVIVSQADAACATTDVTATGGSVVITSVGAGGVKGTVDATLPGGGAVTGSFDAAPCAVDLLAQGDVCSGQIGPPTRTCAP